jgi:hypothetical protein
MKCLKTEFSGKYLDLREDVSEKYKPLGKGQLGRPRWRWEDKIKIDIVELG